MDGEDGQSALVVAPDSCGQLDVLLSTKKEDGESQLVLRYPPFFNS